MENTEDNGPTIEPQVQVEDTTVKTEPEEVPSNLNSLPNPSSSASPSHSYSTRSKERNKEEENIIKSKLKQQKHNVVIHPRLKPVPYKQQDLLVNSQPTKTKTVSINDIDFFQCEDFPFNKRGFKYKPCRPNPIFTSNLYSTTDIEPFKIGPSYFDRSQGINFDNSMTYVTTGQGWRSTRTNVGVREGTHYFEFNIVNANDNGKSHVRIGLGRKEASLEAPVGFDGYSYGLRDINGELMTLSRPKESYVAGGFKTGDTIGMLIELPSLDEHRKMIEKFIASHNVPFTHKEESDSHKRRRKSKKQELVAQNDDFYKHGNILRDQIPIKYKNSLYYEQYEYTNTKAMDHLLNPVSIFGERAVVENESENKAAVKLPRILGSKIRIFKNGVEQEKSIDDIYSFLPTDIENEEAGLSFNTRQQQNPSYRNTDDGSLGYYPMMSVFQGGIVGVNAGPDFKYPPNLTKDGAKVEIEPLSRRYDEAVVEEWYWDIIDEVEARYMDSFDV